MNLIENIIVRLPKAYQLSVYRYTCIWIEKKAYLFGFHDWKVTTCRKNIPNFLAGLDNQNEAIEPAWGIFFNTRDLHYGQTIVIFFCDSEQDSLPKKPSMKYRNSRYQTSAIVLYFQGDNLTQNWNEE